MKYQGRGDERLAIWKRPQDDPVMRALDAIYVLD
jgi:hypothetical protein